MKMQTKYIYITQMMVGKQWVELSYGSGYGSAWHDGSNKTLNLSFKWHQYHRVVDAFKVCCANGFRFG